MLIVEDGSGLENAESYDSVINADAYATAFGRTDWLALEESKKEVRLRLATQYLDTMFTPRYQRAYEVQGLNFPVRRVLLPRGVRQACMELATYPGLPVLMPVAAVNAIASESKAIDGLKKSVTYKSIVGTPTYRVAEAKMRPYVDGSNTGGMKFGTLVPC